MINKTKSLVSIIIPTYNYASYIRFAIESVVSQTYTNWECIIIDDGSSDNTKEIVNEYGRKDQRIKYIFQTNKGPSNARNHGLKIAKGDYIQFLDSDDLLKNSKIKKQVDLLAKYPEVDAVFCHSTQFWGEGHPDNVAQQEVLEFGPWEDSLANFISANNFPIHSFLIRNGVFQTIRFDETLQANEDRFFWTLYALEGRKFDHVPEALIYRRLRHGSNSMTLGNMLGAFVQYYNKLLPLLDRFCKEEKVKYKKIILMECFKWYAGSNNTQYYCNYQDIAKGLLKEIPLFFFADKINKREELKELLHDARQILIDENLYPVFEQLNLLQIVLFRGMALLYFGYLKLFSYRLRGQTRVKNIFYKTLMIFNKIFKVKTPV